MAWGISSSVRRAKPESSAPAGGASRGSASPNLAFTASLMVVIIAAFVLSVVFPVESSVRWSLYLSLLLVLAAVVIKSFISTAPEVAPLAPPAEVELERTGELTRLVTVIRRAERGLRYSQRLVALRVRGAFLGKLKTRRSLSQAELDELLSDGEALRGVIRDLAILDFLSKTPSEDVLLSRDPSSTYPVFGTAPGQSFTREIARVVEAMEAWE